MSFGSATSELTTVPGASLDDLNLEALTPWLRTSFPHLAADHVPLEDALMRLRLASVMGQRVVPHLATIVAFGTEPQWLAPNLGVALAVYSGPTMTSEIRERLHLSGDLKTLHDRTMAAVDAHANQIINQALPTEVSMEFSRRAVFEAVSNALIHRDLRATGTVQVRLFPNRLEVWSPGPPSGLPENLESYITHPGVSLPRNPTLAVLARQLGLAEQLGRGLAVMAESVQREAGSRLEIRTSKEGVTVIIPSLVAVMRQLRSDRN